MILTTTPTVEGCTIDAYKGIVTGEAVLGANLVRDLFASVRDIVGGRSALMKRSCRERARSRWTRCASSSQAVIVR